MRPLDECPLKVEETDRLTARAAFEAMGFQFSPMDLDAMEILIGRIRVDERTKALAWTEDDQPLPEDDAIHAAHPLETGRHDLYLDAMRLVGAKRSKGALVELVCWLLHRPLTTRCVR